MTHCTGYRASAVAWSRDIAALGIDAESHAPLPAGVLERIARSEEREQLRALAAAESSIHWDRLLFSAKESVYKAWFPLTEEWLGFDDGSISFERSTRTFSARLLVDGPVVSGRRLTDLHGRWMARGGLAITAIAVPAA